MKPKSIELEITVRCVCGEQLSVKLSRDQYGRPCIIADPCDCTLAEYKREHDASEPFDMVSYANRVLGGGVRG